MTKEKTASENFDVATAAGNLYLVSALAQDEAALKTLTTHLDGKAKVAKAESLGKKTLAYPINKHKELYLLSVFFTAEPNEIPGLEKELSHEDEIERFLVTTWRGDINKEPRSDRPRREHAKSATKSEVEA